MKLKKVIQTPVEEQKIEEKIPEEPVHKTRRGRPSNAELEARKKAEEDAERKAEEEKLAKEREEKEEKEKEINSSNNIKESSNNMNNNDDNRNYSNNSNYASNGYDEEIGDKVLQFVCEQTINNLKDNHKSNIYTQEFANKLFNNFLDGSMDSSNPLFVELIKECIENEEKDAYLGDLTKEVLNYIINS